jgi:hypothetical protein
MDVQFATVILITKYSTVSSVFLTAHFTPGMEQCFGVFTCIYHGQQRSAVDQHLQNVNKVQ